MRAAPFIKLPNKSLEAKVQFRYGLLMAIMIAIISAAACASAAEFFQKSGPLLHTFVELKAYGDNETADVLDGAFTEMERVNSLLNNYDPSSEVSALNTASSRRWVTISPDTFEALNIAQTYARLSGGAFDFTVGPLVSLWGFNKDQPGLADEDPSQAMIKDTMRLVDYRALKFIRHQSVISGRLEHSGMRIDVGAFSKGFAADKALYFLQHHGITSALVAAGGTICAVGSKPDGQPWQIGIRHPRNDSSFLTVVALRDQSVSTSGDYEKFYYKAGKRRSHIIDPRTGYPVTAIQSVTVIAPTGIASDSLSTSLFVLGPADGIRLIKKLPGCEALIVTADGEVVYTNGWPQKTIIY